MTYVKFNKLFDHKIVIIFLLVNENMFWVLEYPQHMFWLRNKKNNFQ